MSWEQMDLRKCKCPCGKGEITQPWYMDDWNRTKDGEIIIQCPECREKYRIESKTYHTCDGESYTIHYLTPKDYPAYDGPDENLACQNRKATQFHEFLIENYSLDTLKNAQAEYEKKRSSSNLTPKTREICNYHKYYFHSVKASLVIEQIKKAIEEYEDYRALYEKRMIVRKNEEKARRDYEEEKRKHQIRIDF